MAVSPLHATQEAGLTGDIDGASRLAFATEIAGADLVGAVGACAGVEAGRRQFGGGIDLNGCRRHGAQAENEMPTGRGVKKQSGENDPGEFSESADLTCAE